MSNRLCKVIHIEQAARISNRDSIALPQPFVTCNRVSPLTATPHKTSNAAFGKTG